MRVLLVEDDTELREDLAGALSCAGFAVDATAEGVDAEFLGDEIAYDAVVLDLGLPDRPGLEILRAWRARGNRAPVLVLTARDAWYQRVEGLNAGADDYLGKPFHLEELVARLGGLVRRARGATPGVLEAGGLRLDEERQCVRTAGGEELPLTGIEFRLLRYLMLHPGRPLSKTRLSEHVYEDEREHDSNVLEVHVRRLRRKLGDDVIQTRRGQGYVFRGVA